MTTSSGPEDHRPIGPASLFVYGTLQFPEVLRVLFGRVPRGTPASVAGWKVVTVPGTVYATLASAEATATGEVINDLTQDNWRMLDTFHDNFYELCRLTLTDGRDTWAYACPDISRASTSDWAVDAFEHDHLITYLRYCAAWRHKFEHRIENIGESGH
jgi:hypothetical protein